MTKHALLLAALTLVGCSRSSSEPADTRKLPPGVGPGAIGSLTVLDPILAEHCTRTIEVAAQYNHDPRKWKDGLDANGRPPGRSVEYHRHCHGTDGSIEEVVVIYHKLDAPDGWQNPVYQMYFQSRRDALLARINLYAAPFLSREARRTLGEIMDATINGTAPEGHTWILDDRLRIALTFVANPEAPIATAGIKGNFKGASGDLFSP